MFNKARVSFFSCYCSNSCLPSFSHFHWTLVYVSAAFLSFFVSLRNNALDVFLLGLV